MKMTITSHDSWQRSPLSASRYLPDVKISDEMGTLGFEYDVLELYHMLSTFQYHIEKRDRNLDESQAILQ